MKVVEVERKLYRAFPQAQAEDWDNPGLSIGEPQADVEGIACALDPLPSSIEGARARGCNVLVTHHPAFLEAPCPITPIPHDSSLAGAIVWSAISQGVSLVAMHTNLDRSDAALDLCAEKAGLVRIGRIEDPDGYGALLEGDGSSVADLAARLDQTLGGTARIWGAPESKPRLVGFCSGSLGDLGESARARGCTCVIAGECGYHRVLDLISAGCAVILVGHDVSELPYAGLLADTITAIMPGVPCVTLDDGPRWTTARAQDDKGRA